jgi:flagellar hook assembly protein FlgD
VTKIRFSTASAGLVHLDIYDIQGRRVARLADEVLAAGEHERVWDGRNSQGRELASGVYLAQLEFAGQRFQKKLTLIK